MSTDPYHAVQAEMQGTLANAGTLLSSFRRIRGMAVSTSGAGYPEEGEELSYARSELKATLAALEADLEDLEESVRVVETTGPRFFGLDDREVQIRKQYVHEVRQELDNMRAEVASTENQLSSGSSRYALSSPTSRPKSGFVNSKPNATPDDSPGPNNDDQSEWSRMEQQMIMEEQDRTLDQMHGTLSTITEQAGLMGREIGEHVDLLDDLEQNLDRTETKLNKSLRRLQKFARETEETKSGWCIGILIVILMVLLLMCIGAMSGNSTALQSDAKSQTTNTFITSLWTNAGIFGIEILAFTILRVYFSRIYEPRRLPVPEGKKALQDRKWTWPIGVWKSDFTKIKDTNGVDSYMFVRFLRMMVTFFGPVWFISWAVLLPVDGVSSGLGNEGLERFTFGNIGTEKQGRYWAHLVCAWVFTAWMCYLISREMTHFLDTRQVHLVSEAHSKTAQANTVLITGIKKQMLKEEAIKRLFSHLPGGVRKVWFNRDLKDLPDLYERRLKACDMLEKAETKLLGIAAIAHLKESDKAEESSSPTSISSGSSKFNKSTKSPIDKERGVSVSRAEGLVPDKERPTHRRPIGGLPFSLPLIGKKVDTIDWARQEILETTKELEIRRKVLRKEVGEKEAAKMRKGGLVGLVNRMHTSSDSESSHDENIDSQGQALNAKGKRDRKKRKKRERKEEVKRAKKEEYPTLNSAFILFNQQLAAHLAVQSLTYHEPYRMSTKYIEVAPKDVIWGNLGLEPVECKIRQAISYAITLGLIVLWSIPVAFIGATSNVSGLCTTYTWLSWLCELPDTLIGLIQGVLPAALLAGLMILLPVFLRYLAKFEGIPSKTGVELSLMTRYFIFQVIHSFLIVTLSSGIIAALPGLVEDPASIPALLASSLPEASNFFLTYTVLQGLTGTASGFLQVVPFFLYYVKLFILGSTPRSIYKIKCDLRDIKWGKLFPATTLICVISIAYSVISPIINGLAFLTFFLFFELYKYLFLYQLGQPPEGDTGGLFFPKAIQHIFVGVYIQQICLCTLFFLARNSQAEPSALPQAGLMVVLLFATGFYHLLLNNMYKQLFKALPISLADRTHKNPIHRPSPINSREDLSDFIDLEDGDLGSSSLRRRTTATSSTRQGRGMDRSEPTVEDPLDFYHPASVRPQRAIWIPQDELGLGEAEVAENERLGIFSSCRDAFMDKDGQVDIKEDCIPPEPHFDDD